jgi:hypothetical protein
MKLGVWVVLDALTLSPRSFTPGVAIGTRGRPGHIAARASDPKIRRPGRPAGPFELDSIVGREASRTHNCCERGIAHALQRVPPPRSSGRPAGTKKGAAGAHCTGGASHARGYTSQRLTEFDPPPGWQVS